MIEGVSIESMVVATGLVVTMLLTHWLYVKSVQPARLTGRMGERAYRRSANYRALASLAMMLHVAAMVGYYLYPLPMGIPLAFGWGWSVSAIIAAVIGLPAAYLMWRGARDAGSETMVPERSHTLYGGIYEKIRHPQAVGEAPLWTVIAFLLDSPFLVILSLLWYPLMIYWCYAEERDLVIRYGAPYEEYRRRVGMFWPRG